MISIIGGLILIIGAYFLYQGDILKSTLAYFFADVCWVVLALGRNEIFGAIAIGTGMLAGLLVFIKMNTGIFNKSIRKDTE